MDSISWTIIDKMFKENDNFLTKHHLDSYNRFFDTGIKEVFKNQNPMKFYRTKDEKHKIFKHRANIYFGGKNADRIYYGKPIIFDKDEDGERQHYMYPNEARVRNMTYGFTIHYDVVIDFSILIDNNSGDENLRLPSEEHAGIPRKYDVHNETITLEKIYLGRFPIMLQSNLCFLRGLEPEARFNLGECRNDIGGYFIIDGKEKVIMSQEGRADNILYVKEGYSEIYSHAAEIRSVSEDSSKPIRTLSVRMVAPQPTASNGQIVVNIPNVRKPVPLFIVMRALGITSDKEIIQACLLDIEKYDYLVEYFRPCVHHAGRIFTQTQALKFIAELMKHKTISHALDMLSSYFIPHIGELNFKNKALYLGYIVKKLLLVVNKNEKPTDRDSYGYKRIEIAGTLISQLFKEYYTKQLKSINLYIDSKFFYESNNGETYHGMDFKNLILNNTNEMFMKRIVEEGFRKGFKGNWGAEEHTKRLGLVQGLNRLSFFSALCQLRKTNLPLAAEGAKVVAPRLLHATQWGYLCPLHSPDGGNVGLHKHLSTSTVITSGTSGKPYVKLVRELGMKLLDECSYKELSNLSKVFVNGAWVGSAHFPMKIIEKLRLMKRNSIIDIYTSISFNTKKNEIIIWTDSGRPCRPLYYMHSDNVLSHERSDIKEKFDNKKISFKQIVGGFGNYELMDSKNAPDSLLKKQSSVVEYVDTIECEGNYIAKSTTSRDDYVKNRVTHQEIDPSLILGVMANQIIFPENNPYPRNAFSCGQAKQGVSMFHSNFRNRIDKTSYLLNYGQIPLTKSRYLDYATKEQHPYGENAIVAVMCYSGFNVEDAVIVNKGSLERGLFRTTYYNMYEDHEETKSVGNAVIDKRFMNIEDNNVIDLKPGYDYSKLDKTTGLIKENEEVTEKTIVIGKTTPLFGDNEGSFRDDSVTPKKGQVGYVDKSFITRGEEGKRIAKVRIRAERIPAIGDKFCSRAGQKGTIGIILDEKDMPTTANGIRPDIIVNPHAMPSRMTIGHLVETITSKTAAIYGGFGNCTAFMQKGPKHELFGKALVEAGYHSSGNELLYNGMTGEQLETEIYFGPTYYLRLKHMPKDKINYRATGPRTVMTRQTVQGRANNGGLRVGEMDRDCVIAHGLNYFLNESMMVRGDEFYMAICNKSGTIAIYNEQNNLFLSPFVDGPVKFVTNINNEINVKNVSKFGKDFSIVRVPYAFKLLMQELQAMNVQMRIITEDNVDSLTSLQESDNIVRLTKFNDLSEIANENKKQIIDSEKNNFFKDTTVLIEKEAPKLIKNTTIVNIENDDWDDETNKLSLKMNMPEQSFLDTITVNDITINIGDTVKVDELNKTFDKEFTFNVVEITQDKDDLEQYSIKLEDLETGEFKFIQDITKIEKVTEAVIPKPVISMDTEELDASPKSPSYDPFNPKEPVEQNSIIPTINAPVETDMLQQEDYESTDEEDSYEGYDDEDDIYGDIKKPKITIINEGEMDNKDLEILTVDDINEKNDEETSEDNDNIVKKGIKIDV
jgi:DNA-directed RNA polymerase II subunit RPB2